MEKNYVLSDCPSLYMSPVFKHRKRTSLRTSPDFITTGQPDITTFQASQAPWSAVSERWWAHSLRWCWYPGSHGLHGMMKHMDDLEDPHLRFDQNMWQKRSHKLQFYLQESYNIFFTDLIWTKWDVTSKRFGNDLTFKIFKYIILYFLSKKMEFAGKKWGLSSCLAATRGEAWIDWDQIVIHPPVIQTWPGNNAGNLSEWQ